MHIWESSLANGFSKKISTPFSPLYWKKFRGKTRENVWKKISAHFLCPFFGEIWRFFEASADYFKPFLFSFFRSWKMGERNFGVEKSGGYTKECVKQLYVRISCVSGRNGILKKKRENTFSEISKPRIFIWIWGSGRRTFSDEKMISYVTSFIIHSHPPLSLRTPKVCKKGVTQSISHIFLFSNPAEPLFKLALSPRFFNTLR